jgi:hypothetical protein
MPSRGLKYTTAIQQLRDQGLTDTKIAERLSIGRSIVARNLFQSRSKQKLARLMATAGLHALKQVLVSCELGWRWVEAERLKLIEGKSSLTAENIGTLMRSQEKALDMARAFLGKKFTPESLAKAERVDPQLQKARERLEQLQGTRLKNQPIEDAEEVDDEE